MRKQKNYFISAKKIGFEFSNVEVLCVLLSLIARLSDFEKKVVVPLCSLNIKNDKTIWIHSKFSLKF